ncbi:hypothetical protein ACOBQX_12090 [Actinokineospora sp. G85]|uniref:hypothetical protein n=1 Tax=Actinokineospora sp. G85 TaxID=3406626 RepID=UPI003C771CED
MSLTLEDLVARAHAICGQLPPSNVAEVTSWIDDVAGPVLHHVQQRRSQAVRDLIVRAR